MPASQGTWGFIAADLIHYPTTEHSFIHDLESFFYVLLYLCMLYLDTPWEAGKRSAFLDIILSPRRYGNEGYSSMAKHFFMGVQGLAAWQGLTFTSNTPLTDLLYNLKAALSKRYTTEQKNTGVPSFMSKEEYDGLEFKHDDMVRLFDVALSSHGWPEKDKSKERLTVPSNSSAALKQLGTKRSWTHLESSASSSSSSKQLNSGLVM